MASKKEQKEDARRQREEREAEERKKQRRKRRIWQIGAIVVVAAAAIIIAVVISSGSSSDTKPSEDEAQQTASLFDGVAQSERTLGNPDAKVTIYEFADLQCPFCRDFTKDTFPQIVDKYVRPGKVKIEFRNLTFLGPDSVTAARAAAAAGNQNKLWDFVDLFYQNQGAENSGYVTDAFIQDLASKIVGMDTEKLTADMSAPLVEQQLGEAQNQAAEFKIDSTPSFLVQLKGGDPEPLGNKGTDFDEISKLIDAKLEEAGK